MGGAKQLLMEDEERGFHSMGDHHVCGACAGEPALSDFVGDHADALRCDYCGTNSTDEPIAVDVDILLAHIVSSLRTEYTDPANELPYETAEGGYQGEVMATMDLLEAEGCDLQRALLDEVMSAIGDMLWCRRDYFGLPRHQALMAGWERFCEHVTHETRYFFLSTSSASGSSIRDPDIPGPQATLRAIGDVVMETDQLREFPAGSPWFRARVHLPDQIPVGAAELGPPPREVASANRMSPAGIPMFYGTGEPDTAIAEVTSVPSNARYPFVTVGTFLSARPSVLVDLTSLPDVPSIFAEAGRDMREPLRFLHAFASELSRPVVLDALEHLEYIPTQAVTEWFRRVFPIGERRHADGVLYRSARRPEGTCCVLFVGNEQCTDATAGWERDAAKSLALVHSRTSVVHRGYLRFLASRDLPELRTAGLRSLRREELFTAAEWGDFVLRHVPDTTEYMEFSSACRVAGARYGLEQWVVERACLQKDYHPELEPYPIEARGPRSTIVVESDVDLLFQRWLLYFAWELGLRVVIRRQRTEIVPISIPHAPRPEEPLTDAHRPALADAFRWRVEIPSSYPPAAAAAVARDEQEVVHELLRRLGYDFAEAEFIDTEAGKWE